MPELFDPVIEVDGRTHHCVASIEGLDQLCAAMAQQETVALDWETTIAELWNPTFDYLGISIAWTTTESYYIPIGHELASQGNFFQAPPPRIPLEIVREKLGAILPKLQLLMHNAKFDAAVLRKAEIPFDPNTIWDTYIAAGLLNDNLQKKLNLKALAREWLGRVSKEITDVTGNKKDFNLRCTPIELVTEYSGDDACNTVGLWQVEKRKFRRYAGEQNQLFTIFRKLEMPIVPLVGSMEQAGIRVDVGKLHQIRTHADLICDRALVRMQRECDYEFNPGRSEHVRHMLYDHFCLPIAKKAGKETAERHQLEVIFELMKGEPRRRAKGFFKAWCAWSQANKIRNTYTNSIWERLDHEGKIHPSFFQISTMTGRMSSGRPINFQNIIRDAGPLLDVRSAFIPDEDCVFVLADYSQMEFKIASAFSEDPKLVAAANDPKIDVHKNTARAIFHLDSVEQVTKDQRQAAKTTTYQIQYLCSSYGLAKALLLKPEQAQKVIDAYFAEYPGLLIWVDKMKKLILRQGYSTTFFGRRRWANLKYLRSPVKETQDGEFRKLVNTRVQGTGADIIKQAMKKVARWLREEGLRSQIIGQIHDELVVLCPKSEAARVAKKVTELMTTRILDVTLPVDADIKVSLSKDKAALWTGE